MANITDYLFKGSNIGNKGVLADGINSPELLFLIQKKIFGLATTIPDQNYTKEVQPNQFYGQSSALANIHFTKRYAQYVPLSNPMCTNISLFGSFNIQTAEIDNNFSNLTYNTFYNCNLNYAPNTSRYISKTYPYIVYYSNILLTSITNTALKKSTSLYKSKESTYGHPLLINSISQYYDQSYTQFLTFSNTNTSIANTDGFWLLDNDTGLVTFYDSNSSGNQVSTSNPPRISFYRYEGLFGEANILEGQDL
jgi:hypothetical protein